MRSLESPASITALVTPPHVTTVGLLAQPVTGTSQGGPFVVTAGFLADYQSDSIFRSSFESCPP